MTETIHGRYTSGSLFQGRNTSQWVAQASYAGVKRFDTKQEAIDWLGSYGVFDK